MLQWTAEEKTLWNIKIIIGKVWRMNRRQLCFYYEKLQEKQPKILPGLLGTVFLEKMKWISDRETDAAGKVWADLMQDAQHILEIIRAEQRMNSKIEPAVLEELENQQNRHFRTEMGAAFILVFKEKIGLCMPEKRQQPEEKIQTGNTVLIISGEEKRDLEQIAAQLMEDISGAGNICLMQKGKSKKYCFCREWARPAAVFVFSALSACCMAIWLYGQIGRNLDSWNLQQMKASAVQMKDAFSEENPQIKERTISQSKKQNNAEQTADNEKLPDVKEELKHPQILPQYREMAREYPELYGWLKIPDTQIDLPVMRAESDREFYLYHDFSGAQSAEGALFVDTDSSCCPQDDNTVIYGHNMKNGHVFGTLKMYRDADFFQAHREIRFDTIYETGTYEAVAVLKTRILNENEPGFRYYRFFQYENKEEFRECRNFVEENRLFETDSTLRYGDRILMLSTCEYSQENGRLVVVARKSMNNSSMLFFK